MASFMFLEEYSERCLDLFVSVCRVPLKGYIKIWSFGLPTGRGTGWLGDGQEVEFYSRPFMNLILKVLYAFQDWKQEQEVYCRYPGQM